MKNGTYLFGLCIRFLIHLALLYVSEMKNSNSVSDKTPSLSESISVSDVLYQLSSLRKVRIQLFMS